MPFPLSGSAGPQVCVYISGDDVDQAYRIIQDYSVAATWFMIGPRLWSAYGADAVRRMLLLNDSRGRKAVRILLDARLYGDVSELPDIIQAMYDSGIRGTTIAATGGLHAMCAAATTAKQLTKTDKAGFVIMAYGAPELRQFRQSSDAYTDARMRRLCCTATAANVDMMLVQHIDWQEVKRLSPQLPLCVTAERAARDYDRPGSGNGVREWIRAGLRFVLYDPLVLCGPRWGEDDAELLRVEATMAMEKPKIARKNKDVVRELLNGRHRELAYA